MDDIAVAGAPGAIAATEELLGLLPLQGMIVTVDANGGLCRIDQKEDE